MHQYRITKYNKKYKINIYMVGIMKKQFVNTRLVTMLQFEREKERLYIFNKTYLNRLSIPIEKVVQNHLKCNQHHYLQLLVSFE